MDSKWSCTERPTSKVQNSKVTNINRDFSTIRPHTLWRKKIIPNKTVRFMFKNTNYNLQITLLIILFVLKQRMYNNKFTVHFYWSDFSYYNEYGYIIRYRIYILISLSFKIKLKTLMMPDVTSRKSYSRISHI